MSRIYTRQSIELPCQAYGIGTDKARLWLAGWIDGIARNIALHNRVDIYGLGYFTTYKTNITYTINPATGRKVIASYQTEPMFEFSPEFVAKFNAHKLP